MDSMPLANDAQDEAEFQRARLLEQRGDLEAAAAAYLKLVDHAPHYAQAHHRLAVVNERLGQHKLVDGCYQAATELAPRDVELLCDYGYSLYLREQYEAAGYQLRRALAQNPGHARANAHLALVQVRQGEPDQALASFRRAGCSDSEARANVAFGLMLQEKWTQAAQYVQDALQREPGSPLLQQRHTEIQQALAGAGHPSAPQSAEFVGRDQLPSETIKASYLSQDELKSPR